VFHATGIGGQAMEKLIDGGKIEGVIDLTTTEICDMLMGGVFPATDDRFGAMIRRKMPYVGSVGALDMVNFGAPETVPEKYRDRVFYEHNPQVTLMRTTPEECTRMGRLDRRAAQRDGRPGSLLPARRRGLGAGCDRPTLRRSGRRATRLFTALEDTVRQTSTRRLIRLPTISTIPNSPPQWCPPSASSMAGGPKREGATMMTGKAYCHGSATWWLRAIPIVGGGAGTGLSAKCEEAGGIDLIVIYNSGRYRMAGRGSLAGLMPYGDANAIVVEMASKCCRWCERRRCWRVYARLIRSG
jgi:hypothetical protein